jgi:hypothetical protein
MEAEATVEVSLTRSVDQFAQRAGEFLRARIEHNVLATVLEIARRFSDTENLFATVADADGETVAAALRVRGRRLLASEMDERCAIALLGAWLEADPGIPGVGAPAAVARSIADEFQRSTGRGNTLAMEMALHALARVEGPARPAAGALRPAGDGDRDLLIDWMRDFGHEAGVEDDPAQMVDRRPMYVWEDGTPVAVVARSDEVAEVVRIGPVYTPVQYRNRGYASSAVAALSRAALEAGARQCILYTDLANPSSNRIYAALGYRRVGDWEDRVFDPR